MAYDTKWRDDLQVSKIIRTSKPTATKQLSTKTLSTKAEAAPPRRRSFLSQPKIPVDAFNPMSFWDPRDKQRQNDTRVRFFINKPSYGLNIQHPLKWYVVCFCELNKTQYCDEHLFGQVSTCIGCYQLPIFCCTFVHQ